ncbi:hypothetical protein GCM10009605_48450 [Nocardiopsis composta]
MPPRPLRRANGGPPPVCAAIPLGPAAHPPDRPEDGAVRHIGRRPRGLVPAGAAGAPGMR